MRSRSDLVEIEGVVLELVDLDVGNVLFVHDGAATSDVGQGNDVGVHGCDYEMKVGDVAIRDVAGTEVVRYSHAGLDGRAGGGMRGNRRGGKKFHHARNEVGLSLAA